MALRNRPVFSHDAAQEIVGHRGVGLVLQDAQGELLHQGVLPHLERVARPHEDLGGSHVSFVYPRRPGAHLGAELALLSRLGGIVRGDREVVQAAILQTLDLIVVAAPASRGESPCAAPVPR